MTYPIISYVIYLLIYNITNTHAFNFEIKKKMAAAIYKFFSDPHVSDPSDPKNLTYSCYHCGEEKKARLGTPSNLKNH